MLDGSLILSEIADGMDFSVIDGDVGGWSVVGYGMFPTWFLWPMMADRHENVRTLSGDGERGRGGKAIKGEYIASKLRDERRKIVAIAAAVDDGGDEKQISAALSRRDVLKRSQFSMF